MPSYGNAQVVVNDVHNLFGKVFLISKYHKNIDSHCIYRQDVACFRSLQAVDNHEKPTLTFKEQKSELKLKGLFIYRAHQRANRICPK